MRNFWIAVLMLLLLPISAMAQSDDRDALTAFLEDNLSGAGRKVTVTGFRGAFSSQAEMDSLTIADDEGVWLTLNNVVLNWSRASLLRGVVSVTELSVDEAIIARAPISQADGVPAPEATGFSLPELPVSVDIKKLVAKRIELGAPLLGEKIEGSLEASLGLDGGDGNADILIERTDSGPQGRLALKASYSNAGKDLIVDLDLTEGAGGIAAKQLGLPGTPSVSLTVKGEGPLDDFAADLALRTDDQDRLAGKVILTGQNDGAQKFVLDLGGDVAPLFIPEYADFFGPEVALKAEGQRSTLGKLDLNALQLTTRAVQLDGSAVIAPDGLPQRFTLVGRLGLSSGEPVLLPLGGDVETRVAAADLRVNFDAAQSDGWSMAVNMTGLERADVTVAMASIAGSGRINRRGGEGGPIVGGTMVFGADGVALTDADLALALGSKVDGKLVFDWQKGGLGLRIGRLELNETGYQLALSGRLGDLESGFKVRGSVDASYKDLSRLSGLAQRPLSGVASFRLSGQASTLGGEFDAVGKVNGTDITIGIPELDNLLKGSSDIAFELGRSKAGTFLRKLTIRAQDLLATASGKLATEGSDLKGTLAFSDLSALGAKYAGSLTADAGFTGTAAQGRITLDGIGRNLKIGQQQADALMSGDSRLALAIGVQGTRYVVEQFKISNPQITADATGYYDPAGSDIAATVALPDLAPLGAGYRGALDANVKARGNLDSGRIELVGNGTNLAIGQQQADGLLRGNSALNVAVNIRNQRFDIERAEISNPQIRADVVGYYDPAGSDLTANVALPNLQPLGAGYRGALRAEVKAAGTLEAGRISVSGQGDNLAIGQAEADKLLRGQSTLRAVANFKDRKLQIESATLRNPQLSADVKGTVTEATREIQMQARLANLGLLLPEYSGAVTVQGTAVEDGRGITMNLAGNGPGGIDAKVSGRLGLDMKSANLAINGSGQAALANAFLGNRSISGGTRFDLRLNGPLALSSLSGRVVLSDGRFSDASLPFGLQNINVTANLSNNAAQITGKASPTTGGTLDIDGQIGLAAPNAADLRVRMVDLIIKDPDLYNINLSGDVTLQGPLTGGANIGGNIRIREAELRVPTSGFSAVGSLPGLKHVGEPADVRRTREKAGLIETGPSTGGANAARPFGLNIVIEAPTRIFLRGRGLDAELGGRVTLRGTTANVIPSGAFNLIRGRLDILGKRLVLDQAQLLMQGDLVPYLNVVATNQSGDVQTSVVIEGRADEPEISFRAVPDLPQEEVLARLLFDRGLNKISPLQAAQLATAVATLAGRGGDGIVGNLRKNFGLDDLDVGTDEAGNVSVKAGKYISKNAYTQVEVDQQGRSKINLNLDLRKGVTARGTVGADGQAGIGIFIERDY